MMEQVAFPQLFRQLESKQPDANRQAEPTAYLAHSRYCIDHLDEKHLGHISFLIYEILQQAIKQKASDVHWEPGAQYLAVKYRIDGYLEQVQRIRKDLQEQLLNRLKIMAELDVTERRLPQDGHMQILFHGQEMDLRVSTLPVFYGEKVVLRLLNKELQFISIEQLGFSTINLKKVKELLQIPYGILLVTGPTGSGKSTTLYSILNGLKGKGKNITTLEDPIEYEIAGVNQMQINEKIGLTFARGLRSILRQDPDIVMIGEIRDLESAEIAIRLAYTGHLVLASLHTNDSFGAINRMIEMGIAPYLLANCLHGVIAQRLVRRCHDKGYKGRLALQEVLVCDEAVRDSILHYEKLPLLKREMLANGFMDLARDGWEKVRKGLTTKEELMTVLGLAGDEADEKAAVI